MSFKFHNISRIYYVQNVSELWSMVQHMVNVTVATSGNLAAARTSQQMEMAFVNQALKYLQQRFVLITA